MQIQLTTIAYEDVESYRECLDVMVRERKYLALLEGLSIQNVRRFVARDGSIGGGLVRIDCLGGITHCATVGAWHAPADRLPWARPR